MEAYRHSWLAKMGRGMQIINISKFIECLKIFILNNYVRIFEINYQLEDWNKIKLILFEAPLEKGGIVLQLSVGMSVGRYVGRSVGL